jgi:hypothetical protein
MKDEQLSVKVSGQAVYNAVKNYLNNNQDLRNEITKTAKEMVDAGHLKAQVERLVREHFSSNSFIYKSIVDKIVKEVVAEQVKAKVDLEVQECVRETLKKAVFVMPNLEDK